MRSLSILSLCCLLSLNVAANERLHIALGDNYGIHATRIDGEPAGIQKDLLEWFLIQHMKLDVEIEAMPWTRAQAMVVEYKKSDGYFTAYTRKRVDELKLVPTLRPFYTTHVKMHTWKGNPKIPVLRQLKSIQELLALPDIRHIFISGHGYHEENFKNAKLISRVQTPNQIAKFLLEYKRADLFVEQSELFYPVVKKNGLENMLVTLDNIRFKSLNWHLFLRPDSQFLSLMTQINQALIEAELSGILQAKVREIFNKYGLIYAD